MAAARDKVKGIGLLVSKSTRIRHRKIVIVGKLAITRPAMTFIKRLVVYKKIKQS
ncbi:9252_t:CDS:2 [Diversispora eburnea]|uniref:9252_t:CDS:1 n=1 Tax=Diversispora eburnea TaxID=1213867 RepID=A0A9N8ZI32_9GLOM|nr:9252_t:CDS:2 [Diversispora eburnea]